MLINVKMACIFPKNFFIILKRPGPEDIKCFSCSTQLSMKSLMLINFKMPIIVGILTFIGMINTTAENEKSLFSMLRFILS